MAHGIFSASVDRAMRLAAIVHGHQTRKGTTLPYIVHPVQVARMLDREFGEPLDHDPGGETSDSPLHRDREHDR